MNLRHCGLNRATAQASGRPLRDQQSDAHHIHIPLRWSSFGRAAFRNRFGRRAPHCSRSVQFFAEERPMEEIAAVLTLSQKDGGIPQAPYDAGVQPQGAAPIGLIRVEATPDRSRSRTPSAESRSLGISPVPRRRMLP
jgi:hypothetical protein